MKVKGSHDDGHARVVASSLGGLGDGGLGDGGDGGEGEGGFGDGGGGDGGLGDGGGGDGGGERAAEMAQPEPASVGARAARVRS